MIQKSIYKSPYLVFFIVVSLALLFSFVYASITPPTISFVSPTPDDGTTTANNWTYINLTISDSETPNNITSFINWNNSLVGWWRFNNETGENTTNFRDWSGNGNNATCAGAECPTYDAAGKFNASLQCDGNDDYLKIHSVVTKLDNIFTIIVWVKTSDSGSSENDIVTFHDNDGSENKFRLQTYQGKVRIKYTPGGTFDVSDNKWHHIAAVLNGSNTSLYVDGRLDPVVGYNLCPPGATCTVSSIIDTDVASICQEYDETPDPLTSSNWFTGSIDEIQIWNRVFSKEEVNASYNAGTYRLYHNFTNLTEGTYTYTAYAQDSNGSVNQTETRTIIIGDAPPLISFVSPTPNTGNLTTNSWTYINVSVTNTSIPNNMTSFIDFNHSLIGWWRFNNEAGESTTLFRDWSSYGNNCTCSGSSCPSYNTSGKFGKTLQFDGGDIIRCGTGASLKPGNQMTIEAWVKQDAFVDWAEIVQNAIGEADYNYEFAICNDFPSGQGLCYDWGTGSSWWGEEGPVITSGVWTYFAWTYNTATNTTSQNIRLYKDGNNTHNHTNVTGWSAFSSNLTMGIDFDGLIDEVKIWNRALNPEEINASYNTGLNRLYRNFTGLANGNYNYTAYAQDLSGNVNQTETRTMTVSVYPSISFISPTRDDGSSTANNWTYVNVSVASGSSSTNLTAFIDFDRSLVGWWRFNHEAGETDTVLRDWSSWGNNGTLKNMNPGTDNCTGDCSGWTTSGKFGYGMNFDSTNDYVSVPNATSLKLEDEFTISAWVFLKKGSGGVGSNLGRTVVAKGRVAWAVPYNGFWLRYNSNIWAFSLSNATMDEGGLVTYNDYNKSVNNWTYLTVTFNKGDLKLYKNGTLVSSASSSFTNISANLTNLTIGTYSQDTTYHRFNGTIDEVQIWNRVLSSEEINASYNTGIYRLYHNFTNLTDGTYNYTAYVQDLTGNLNQTETRTMTVSTDSTPLAITILAPGNQSYSTNQIWFNITLSKAGSWVGYSLDGAANVTLTNSSGNWNKLSTIAEGVHNAKFYANDTYGTINSTNVSFTVSIPPSIAFVSPTPNNGNTTTNSWTYINVSVSDALNPNNITAFINWNNSLVGWWRFNNESGENNTFVRDWSSYGNNGTMTNMNLGINNCTGNCSGWTTSGKFGYGINFDGANDRINTTNQSILNIGGNTITIEAWVYPTSSPSMGVIVYKETEDVDTPPRTGYGLQTNSNVLYLYIGNTGSWASSNSGATTVPLRVWSHVAGIYNGSYISVYINGVRAGTETAYSNNILQNSLPLFIGTEKGGAAQFNGTIDEVKVWNRALSPEEINSSYNTGAYRLYNNFTNLTIGTYNYTAYAQDLNGSVNQTETRTLTVSSIVGPQISFVSPTPNDGSTVKKNWTYINVSVTNTTNPNNMTSFIDFNNSLAGWWRFNNETGENSTLFRDWSRYGNNGTCSGGTCPAYTASGKFGPALTFDGSTDYLIIDSLVTELDSVYTISAWIKTSASYSSDFGSIVTFHDSGYNNKWKLQVKSGYDSVDPTTGDFLVNDGKWHHIVSTTNASASRVYVDGRLDSHVFTSVATFADTDRASIGQEWDPGPTASDLFNGIIDEVQIWNRILPIEEINASYNTGVYRLYRNFTNITSGTYNYTAYAQDLTGNVSQTETRVMTIDVDLIIPFVGFVAPTPSSGNVTTNDWTYVNLSVSDSGSPNNLTSFINWNNSLVGWWRFNRETGENDTFVRDWSGYGNNGTMVNMNPGVDNCTENCSGWTESGKFGYGMQFDGANDYVQISSSSSLTISYSTYNMWLKVGPQVQAWSGTNLTVPLFHGSWANGEAFFITNNPSPTFSARAYLGQTVYDLGGASYPIDRDTYHMLTMSLNGTNFRVYMDGVLKYDNASANEGMNLSVLSNPLIIGAAANNYWRDFSGIIDEVSIYNRALSEVEINASYNTGVYRLYHNFTGLPYETYNYTAYAQDLAGNVNQTATRTVTITEVIVYPISFTSPTPDDGTSTTENWTYINVLTDITSSPGNVTAFIDWNRSLVLWIRFDNSSDISDQSSYHRLTTNIASVYNASGKFGGARGFNDATSYIRVDNVSSLLDNVFTISFWMNSTSADASDSLVTFHDSGGNNKWRLEMQSGKITIESTPGSKTVNDGKWHHVMGITNGSLSSIYVDGVLDLGSIPYTITFADTDRASIGQEWDTSTPTDFYEGKIDEVQIWNRVLSEEEINASYNAGVYSLYHNFSNMSDGKYTYTAYAQGLNGTTYSTETRTITIGVPSIAFVSPTPSDAKYTKNNNTYINVSISDLNSPRNITSFINFNNSLVGWWRFNNETGENSTLFRDWSSYGNNCTCSGASCPIYNASGKFDKALQFDNTTPDFIDCGTGASLKPGNQLTLEVWIKQIRFKNWADILWNGPTGTQANFELATCNNVVANGFCIDWGTTGAWHTQSGPALTTGVWTHLVWTYNTATNTTSQNIRLYKDGNNTHNFSDAGGWSAYSSDLTIGSEFNGSIDEVKIWNRALSPEEINASYNTGLNRLYRNFTNTPDGVYNYTAYAQDLAGTTSQTETRTIIIDNVMPFVGFVSPTLANSTFTNNNNLYINVSVSDAASPNDFNSFINFNNSLVGWWRFNRETGENDTFARDWSGYGNNGTINNTNKGIDNGSSGWTTSGKFGNGIAFDGIDDYVDAGNAASMDTTSAMTVEAWSYDDSSGYGTIAGKMDPYNNGWNLFISEGEFWFEVYSGGEWAIIGHQTQYYGDNIYAPVYSHHVVGVFNGTHITLYIDGVPTQWPVPVAQTPYAANTINLTIGGGDRGYFTGVIDEVRVYNRVLSSEEIGAAYNTGVYRLYNNFTNTPDGVYNYTAYAQDLAGNVNQTEMRVITVDTTPPFVGFISPTPANGTFTKNNNTYINISVSDILSPNNLTTFIDFNNSLVGWYRFNLETGESDSVAKDWSTYENDGTISNTNPGIDNCAGNCSGWTVSGKFGNALRFDGVNDYVIISNDVNLQGMSQLTVMGWIYPKNLAANGGMRIVDKSDITTGATGSYKVQIGGAGAGTNYQILTKLWNSTDGVVSFGPNITDSKWLHFAVVYNSTNILLYINGTLYPDASSGTIKSLRGVINSTGANVGVGAFINGVADSFFNGTIDEVQIWNRVLSPEEINATYNTGTYRSYHNFTNFTDGTYTYTAYSQDLAGNVNQTTQTITIDNVIPFVGFVSLTPANNTYTNNNNTYINVSISDAASPNNLTGFIDFNRSLVGWWRFNREAGENDTFTRDWSTWGNNCTLKSMNFGIDNGTSGWTTSGKFGNAIQFDGSNDYADCGTDSSLDLTTGSVEFWFNISAIAGVSTSQIILQKDGSGNVAGDFAISINRQGVVYPDNVLDATSQNTGEVAYSDNEIQPNRWYYVVVTFTPDYIYMYIDGVLQTKTGGTNYGMSNTTRSLYIGDFGGGIGGTIDEVRIYNRALSPEEINASYNTGVYRLYNNFTNTPDGVYNYTAYAQDSAGNVNQTETRTITIDRVQPFVGFVSPTSANNTYTNNNNTYINVSISDAVSPNNHTAFIDFNNSLVGWWRFNRETGENDTFARDWSGYGNNGTMVNMNPGVDNCTGACSGWTASGKLGYGMKFDGSNDRINYSDSQSLNITSGITIETWIKIESIDTTWEKFILAKYDYTSIKGYAIDVNKGQILMKLYGGGVRNEITSNANISVGSWTHVVGTYNGSTRRIYLNGTLDKETTGSITIENAGRTLNIGKTSDSEASVYHFNGTLDEVKVWNRALSPEEINASYNTGVYRLYHNFTNTPDGVYNYTAYAQDLAGNVNQTEMRILTIDTVKPYLIFQSPTPANNSYVNHNWTEANITITELNFDSFKFNWNGTNYSIYDSSLVLGMNFNYNTQMGEGANTVIDNSKYGNTGTIQGTIFGNFENDLDGFELDCGGSPTSAYVTGKLGQAIEIWSDGGDGLACTYKPVGRDVTVGEVFYVWAKGYPNGQIYDGATLTSMVSVETGIAASSSTYEPDWKLYQLTVTTASTGTPYFYFYDGSGASTEAFSSYYDFVTNGSVWSDGNFSKYGMALTFDGNDDYVEVPSSTVGNTNQMTIELWTKPGIQSLGAYQDHKDILRSQCYGGGLWGISTNGGFNTTDRLTIQVGWIPGADTWWTPSTITAVKNEWNHLVLVLNRDTGYASFYRNGQFVDETLQSVGTKPTTTGFRIGTDCAGSYNGSIDEVRIYNRSLSANEVKMHYQSEFKKYNSTNQGFYINVTNQTDGVYNYTAYAQDLAGNVNQTETRRITIDTTPPFVGFVSPTPANNTFTNNNNTYINVSVSDVLSPNNLTGFIDFNRSLVGWWRFNNDLGENTTLFRDWSSHQNNGTCSGSTCPVSAAGKFGSALQFDGTDDYVAVGDNNVLSFGDGTDDYPFTLEAWIKFANTDNGGGYILTKYDSSGGGARRQEYFITAVAPSGNVSISIFDTPEDLRKGVHAASVVTDANWHHVIGIYDGSKTVAGLKIYVDGVSKATVTDYDDVTYVAMENTNKEFEISRVTFSDGSKGYFNGTIDEVKIWNRALSEEEINASYNTGVYRLYHNFTNTPDGVYNYTAYAQDLAGNVNQTETRRLTIDTIPPVIFIQSPTNTTYSITNDIWFNATINEAATWVKYSLDGASNVSLTNTTGKWWAQNASMTAGAHSVNFYANDSAGNINSTAVYFTVTAVGLCQDLKYSLSYVLISNVSSEGTCFTIKANNVTLNGGGYKINYSQVGNGYGINNTGWDNITIRNLNIVQDNSAASGGANHAIYASGMVTSNITNNTISTADNSAYGINLQSSSNSNILANNTITTTNGDGDGIVIQSGNQNTIDNNTITTSGYSAIAINFASSSSNNISNNTLTTLNDVSYGIYLWQSDTNILSNNKIITSGSWSFGLTVDTGSSDNIVTGGSTVGKEGAYYIGTGDATNNFTNTNFTALRNITIEDAGSWFNYRNDSSNNIWLKTNFSLTAGGSVNRTLLTWSNSTMRWNDTNGTAGLSAKYNITGLLPTTTYAIYNTSGSTRTRAYLSTTDSSGVLPSFDISLIANIEIHVQALNLSACQDLDLPEAYNLVASVNSSGSCFTIKSDNVTLDGKGYTITFAQSQTGYGINNTVGGYDNITLKNLYLTNGSTSSSSYAVRFTSSTLNNIINNTINTRSDALVFATTTNSNISNNTLTALGTTANAIYLSSNSNSNLMTENNLTVASATAITIGISNSQYNRIIGGSIQALQSAAYSFNAAGTDNNFTNTNFTVLRNITFFDAISWFNYNNETSGNIWLKTNASAASSINRMLVNWNNLVMRWNETNGTAGLMTRYNITGMLPSTTYYVYNTSAGTRTNTYVLTSDASGNLPSFTITLNGNTEIAVGTPTMVSINSANSNWNWTVPYNGDKIRLGNETDWQWTAFNNSGAGWIIPRGGATNWSWT